MSGLKVSPMKRVKRQMFEIKISPKIKWKNSEIENVLQDVIKEGIKVCPNCNSKNIKVYVYDIQKSGAISGYIFCKDCNKKSVLRGKQNVFKELDKLEKKIKRMFK